LLDERGHGFTSLVRGTFDLLEQVLVQANRGSHIPKLSTVCQYVKEGARTSVLNCGL
jgi:hypothetical protein